MMERFQSRSRVITIHEKGAFESNTETFESNTETEGTPVVVVGVGVVVYGIIIYGIIVCKESEQQWPSIIVFPDLQVSCPSLSDTCTSYRSCSQALHYMDV